MSVRLINLSIVLYKIISKSIVIQLRWLMQVLVKQNQSSSKPSRNISDNIIIAQEAIYTMKNTKSKKGLTVVQVDLEKVYDRVQ